MVSNVAVCGWSQCWVVAIDTSESSGDLRVSTAQTIGEWTSGDLSSIPLFVQVP